MDEPDIAALVALMRVEGAGNGAGRRALQIAHLTGLGIRALRDTNTADVLARLPAGTFDAVLRQLKQITDADLECAARHVGRVLHHGVHCFSFADECYPGLLSQHLGEAAPALVWCAGNLSLLREYGAGVVGTRTPSRVGEAIASDCARFFVGLGATIISGGADGVDTAAHRAALEAAGESVVVLPQGIRTYPFPGYIREGLESNQCALISQFDPELTWQTHAAVTRNATIAALSKLVCVVEPKRMGGSLRTARAAREQGKPVFYYCGATGQEFAQYLKQHGAKSLISENRLIEDELDSIWRSRSARDAGQIPLFD